MNKYLLYERFSMVATVISCIGGGIVVLQRVTDMPVLHWTVGIMTVLLVNWRVSHKLLCKKHPS